MAQGWREREPFKYQSDALLWKKRSENPKVPISPGDSDIADHGQELLERRVFVAAHGQPGRSLATGPETSGNREEGRW